MREPPTTEALGPKRAAVPAPREDPPKRLAPKLEVLRELPPNREDPNEPELPNEGCATLVPGGVKPRDIGDDLTGEAPLRAKLLEPGEFAGPRGIELLEAPGPREELAEPKECQPPSLWAGDEGELKPWADGELYEKWL